MRNNEDRPMGLSEREIKDLRAHVEQRIEIAHSARYDHNPGTVRHQFWIGTLGLADGSYGNEVGYEMATNPNGVLSLSVNGDAVSPADISLLFGDINIRLK